MSKINQAAQNNYRDSAAHVLDLSSMETNTPGDVTGDITVNQLRKGVFNPNPEAAIEQLAASRIPVGGILLTDSVSSPAGVLFVEDLAITGTADDSFIYVYGLVVQVAQNDDNIAIATKVTTALTDSGYFTSAINQGGGIVRVTHKDRLPHVNESTTLNGVTIQGSTIAESPNTAVGYGTWDTAFHNEVKGSVTVYYHKRTG